MEAGTVWKGGGVAAERDGGRGRGRGCLIYWFNSCRCSSLCLLREGGQMEHAAQNTQTKSHFLSTSQPPLFASPCLSLALFSPSNPLLPSTLPHFSHFPPPSAGPDWLTDWLTDSLCPTTAPVKMEKRGAQHLPDRFCNLLTLCLRVVLFCFVLCFVLWVLANAVQRARPTQQSWEMRPPLEARPAKLIACSVHLLH